MATAARTVTKLLKSWTAFKSHDENVKSRVNDVSGDQMMATEFIEYGITFIENTQVIGSGLNFAMTFCPKRFLSD